MSDDTPITELAKLVTKEFKRMHAELAAYEMTFAGIKAALPQFPEIAGLLKAYGINAQSLDAALAAARQNPALLERMRTQYDVALEMFLQQEAESPTVEEALKLFGQMNKNGPVN